MTKKVMALVVVLLTFFVLTSCTNSSSYYEEMLLQECRSQLSSNGFISYPEVEQITNLEEALPTCALPSYQVFYEKDYPLSFTLSSKEERLIKTAKKEVSHFIKSTLIFTEEDKEKLLTALDLLMVIKVDEPRLPSPVYVSDMLLFIDASSSFTTEDVELAFMRFLRIIAAGSIDFVPYQDSIFESEMAYTILFSRFKDGVDITGYSFFHHQILDFIGIFGQEALRGYFYGYADTVIPEEDLEVFVCALQQENEPVCQTILERWYQQFLVSD